jgi:hypothetical protein
MALDTHVAMTTAVSSAVLVSRHYKFPYQRAVQFVGEKLVVKGCSTWSLSWNLKTFFG